VDRSLWIAGAVALALVGLGVAAWPATPERPPVQIVAATEQTITVHVSGAVASPGLVTVAGEARVADAIAAAGGASSDADLGSLNLAAPVGDGSRILVPDAATAANDAVDSAHVRVNTADAGRLQSLPGVGPVLADRIVRHREEQGPFATVEDLLQVPGIGEATLRGLRDRVIVP